MTEFIDIQWRSRPQGDIGSRLHPLICFLIDQSQRTAEGSSGGLVRQPPPGTYRPSDTANPAEHSQPTGRRLSDPGPSPSPAPPRG